jgi:hypothetical protein
MIGARRCVGIRSLTRCGIEARVLLGLAGVEDVIDAATGALIA